MGKEPLSLEVSLWLKCVTPAHGAAAIGSTDRAVNTRRSKKQWLRQSHPGGTEHARPAHSSPACLPASAQRPFIQRGEQPHSSGRAAAGEAGPEAPIGAAGRAADIFLSPSGAKTCTHPSLSFSKFLVCREDSALAAFAF